MKNPMIKVLPLILMFSLALPWAGVQALEAINTTGQIGKVTRSAFYVAGKKYRLTSNAEVISLNRKGAKLKDLKVGQGVYFRGKRVNGVNYINWVKAYAPE